MYSVSRMNSLPMGGVPALPDKEDENYLHNLSAAASKSDEATALADIEATTGALFDAANAQLASYAMKIEPELESYRKYKTDRIEELRIEQAATDQDILTPTSEPAAKRNKIRRYQAPWALVIFLPLLAAIELTVLGSVVHESRLLEFDNTVFGKTMATLTVVSPFLLGFLKIGQYKILTKDSERTELLKRYQKRAAVWGTLTLIFAILLFGPTKFETPLDFETLERIETPHLELVISLVPYLGIVMLGTMIMANTTISAALFLQEQRDSERSTVCHYRPNEAFENRETALDLRMRDLQGILEDLAQLQATKEALLHARAAFVATAQAEVVAMRARAFQNVVPLRNVA